MISSVDGIKPFDISQSWTGLDGMSVANECLNKMKATRQKKFRPVDKTKPFDISQSWTGLDGMSAANECLNEMKATRQKSSVPETK